MPAREIGYPPGEILALCILSFTAMVSDDLDRAVHLARQAARITVGVPGELVRWCSYALTDALIMAEDMAAADEVCAAGQPLRAARQALGTDRTRTAEERGAAMSLATAVEYALMLTTPEPPQKYTPASPGNLSPGNGNWSPLSPRAAPTPRSPNIYSSASAPCARTWTGSGTRPAAAVAPTSPAWPSAKAWSSQLPGHSAPTSHVGSPTLPITQRKGVSRLLPRSRQRGEPAGKGRHTRPGTGRKDKAMSADQDHPRNAEPVHGNPLVVLVMRAKNGDELAWAALVERYAPLIWGICRKYRLGNSDAADAGQNVWLHLAGQLDKTAGSRRRPRRPRRWLRLRAAGPARRMGGRVLAWIRL